MVLADVHDRAEPQVVACMIKDDEPVFALSRAQAAAYLLNEEDARLGRLGVNDAADVSVEAGGQNADADEDLRGAGSKPAKHGLAVLAGSFPVEIFDVD